MPVTRRARRVLVFVTVAAVAIIVVLALNLSRALDDIEIADGYY